MDIYNQHAFARPNSKGCTDRQEGLTKLEYFTAIAMQGMISAGSLDEKAISRKAIIIAKATLGALQETKK